MDAALRLLLPQGCQTASLPTLTRLGLSCEFAREQCLDLRSNSLRWQLVLWITLFATSAFVTAMLVNLYRHTALVPFLAVG